MKMFCFKERDFIFIGLWGEVALKIKTSTENTNGSWSPYLALFLIIKPSSENAGLYLGLTAGVMHLWMIVTCALWGTGILRLEIHGQYLDLGIFLPNLDFPMLPRTPGFPQHPL